LLDYDALAGMRATARTLQSAEFAQSAAARPFELRIVLVEAPLVAAKITRSFQSSAFKILSCCSEPDAAASARAGMEADIVLVALPTMGDTGLQRVDVIDTACDAPRAVLLYRFGTSSAIQHLRTESHTVVPATMTANETRLLAPGSVNFSSGESKNTKPSGCVRVRLRGGAQHGQHETLQIT
jgi:hypothetical protein